MQRLWSTFLFALVAVPHANAQDWRMHGGEIAVEPQILLLMLGVPAAAADIQIDENISVRTHLALSGSLQRIGAGALYFLNGPKEDGAYGEACAYLQRRHVSDVTGAATIGLTKLYAQVGYKVFGIFTPKTFGKFAVGLQTSAAKKSAGDTLLYKASPEDADRGLVKAHIDIGFGVSF